MDLSCNLIFPRYIIHIFVGPEWAARLVAVADGPSAPSLNRVMLGSSSKLEKRTRKSRSVKDFGNSCNVLIYFLLPSVFLAFCGEFRLRPRVWLLRDEEVQEQWCSYFFSACTPGSSSWDRRS
ncbi:hypothetical protein B0H12DRAFT_86779 [Mycena haematopus]|nr:hypothetical protein B0H12DRAFT_86779 [Mycena haematopus]